MSDVTKDKPEMFEYVAIAKGTLSNPYRDVKPGDVVRLKKEKKASWLVPREKYKANSKTLPVMANLKPNTPKSSLTSHEVPSGDATYNEAIRGILLMEAKQDGAQSALPPAPAVTGEQGAETGAQPGTGNTDVLG